MFRRACATLLVLFSTGDLVANELPELIPGATLVWHNPAAAPLRPAPFLIGGAIGLYVNDRDQLLNGALDAVEEAQGVFRAINENPLAVPEGGNELNESLKELDGKQVNGHGYGALAANLSVAGQDVWLSFQTRGRVAARFEYDEDDEDRLLTASLAGGVTGFELESRMVTSGVFQVDLGVAWVVAPDWFGIDWLQGTRVALRPKYQEVILYQRNVPIQDYAEEKLYDTDRDVEIHRELNADVGLFRQWDDFSLGLQVSDVIPRNFDSVESAVYHQRPQVDMNLSYQTRLALLSLQADVTPDEGFAQVKDRRELAFDSLWPVHERLDLSIGAQWIDGHRDRPALRAGFRYHLLGEFFVQVGVQLAGKRELGAGAAIQLAL